VAQEYKNTLRSQAYQLSALGKIYTQLASQHRVAASAQERGQEAARITYGEYFSDWIFKVCEFSAQAERLLALEIDLARSFGVTWEEVASALGVSRQAAWERFGNREKMAKESTCITFEGRSSSRATAGVA
jgi:hypothetical protein